MKKRAVCFLLAVVLCFCLTGILGRDVSHAQSQTGVVNTSLLNVREGAGTEYPVLQNGGASVQLAAGTKVTILETPKTGWYKVSFTQGSAAMTGYVSSQYIALDPEATPTPTATPSSTDAPVQVSTYRDVITYQKISVSAKTAGVTKVYKSAAGARKVIAKEKVTLASGKKVTILGEKTVKNKKWFKISYKWKKKSRKGYVRNVYLNMKQKSVDAAVANVKSAAKIRKKAGSGAPYKTRQGKIIKLPKNTSVLIQKEKKVKNTKWYKLSFTYNEKKLTGFLNSRYVKLTKKKIVKRQKVTALSSAQFEEAMKAEGFPDTYKQSLRILHQSYPYWQFKAYKTGLNWSTALNKESETGVNLISNAKAAAWKSKASDAYDASTGTWKVFDGSTWVAASRAAVAYYMDPRNFLNERSIFQFESLEYQSQYQTVSGVKTILSNTPFNKKSFTYKDLSTGASKTMTYANAFMTAASTSGVSPYHLASRVKQEVVTSATTTSIAVTGTNSTYPGIYNFYNIGAYSGSNPALNGLKWASTGTTYLRPWTDPYRSIVGGAQYIGSSYISKGQNTGYLQKFNVTPVSRYSHQYMTNVEAANEEAAKTKKAYAGMMDKTPIVFSIPVYNNMPASNCPIPQ